MKSLHIQFSFCFIFYISIIKSFWQMIIRMNFGARVMKCIRFWYSRGIRTDQLWRFQWYSENSLSFNFVFHINCITYLCISYNEATWIDGRCWEIKFTKNIINNWEEWIFQKPSFVSDNMLTQMISKWRRITGINALYKTTESNLKWLSEMNLKLNSMFNIHTYVCC